MDTHDPHNVRIFVHGSCRPEIHIIFFQLLHIAHEMKQSGIAGLFKAFRFGQKHFHIQTALLSAGHGRHCVQITGFFQKLFQQLVDGQIYRHPAVTLQKFQKTLTAQYQICICLFVGCLHRQYHAVIELAFSGVIQRPQHTDLLVCEIAYWRMEYPEHGDILQRIIQNPQKMQYILYLLRRKISCFAGHMHGNLLLDQHLRKHFIPPGSGTQQNHNVTISSRTQAACFFIFHRQFSHQASDFGGHRHCFLVSFIGTVFRKGRDQKFRFVDRCYGFLFFRRRLRPHRILSDHLRLRIHRRRIQSCIAVIFHTAQSSVHQLQKHIIDTVRHFMTAAEVFL